MIYPTFRKQGRHTVYVMLSVAETSLSIAEKLLENSETLRQAQGDKQMKNERIKAKLCNSAF